GGWRQCVWISVARLNPLEMVEKATCADGIGRVAGFDLRGACLAAYQHHGPGVVVQPGIQYHRCADAWSDVEPGAARSLQRRLPAFASGAGHLLPADAGPLSELCPPPRRGAGTDAARPHPASAGGSRDFDCGRHGSRAGGGAEGRVRPSVPGGWSAAALAGLVRTLRL